MKVLIAGGFGYVGGRVARHLFSSGYEVYLASRSQRSLPSWLDEKKFVHLDWKNKQNLSMACQEMDFVVQAAGMNASDCLNKPGLANEVNGLASGRLMESAIELGVKKFIYLSTAHVYSANLGGSINEGTPLTNEHPYALSHVLGEEEVLSRSSRVTTEGIVIRLANAIGAPCNINTECWSLVVNDLCRQAILNKSLTIKNSSVLRNFITLTDVSRAIQHLIEYKSKEHNNNIFNLGDKTMSIYEIALMIKNIYKETKGVDIPILDLTDNIVADKKKNFLYDLEKLELTGFQRKANFREELVELLNMCSLNFKK